MFLPPDLPLDPPSSSSFQRYVGVQRIRISMLLSRQLDIPLSVVYNEMVHDYGYHLDADSEEPF